MARSAFKAVAHAAYRLHQRGMSWVILDPLAQPAHMYIHRTSVARVVVTPDMLQEAVTSKHQSFVADEIDQQVEQARRQLDLSLAALHLMAIHINAQVTSCQHTPLWWRPLDRQVGGTNR